MLQNDIIKNMYSFIYPQSAWSDVSVCICVEADGIIIYLFIY